MRTPLTLEAVKAEFTHWRATKKPNEKIPERLWNLARQLTTRYTRSEIARNLGFAGSQYNQYLNEAHHTKPNQVAPKTNDFVTLMPTNTLINEQTAGLTVEIKHIDGRVILLHAHNQEAIAAILNHVMN